MSTKHLHIPNDCGNQSLNKHQENIDITVNQDCTWCFSDPDGVFGNPSTLLPAGSYTKTSPHTTYGPFTQVNTGTVYFNAVTSGPCNPQGITATGHTITVTGGNK
jgi:hypothetical protein